jgi:Bacteriophage tail sheath protein
LVAGSAPANEVVNLAIGLKQFLNESQQDVLNAEGIQLLPLFRRARHAVVGARTISSDREWKCVNVRRYFAYLARSIDKDTGGVRAEWRTAVGQRATYDRLILSD